VPCRWRSGLQEEEEEEEEEEGLVTAVDTFSLFLWPWWLKACMMTSGGLNNWDNAMKVGPLIAYLETMKAIEDECVKRVNGMKLIREMKEGRWRPWSPLGTSTAPHRERRDTSCFPCVRNTQNII